MATARNQLKAPYSSASWDVFLSFYGKDTRRNFIANLYFALEQAGILTFRDDTAIEKGQEISSGLCNAIKDSNKFVVVISENYARSTWCLNELVEILSCKKKKNQVIPVFYYVDPSALRYQKGCIKEALDIHKKCYSVGIIDKWKSALAEIAELSGYHLKEDANEDSSSLESDTIQEILENVASQASIKVLLLEEHLIGMDSAVEEIYQKLSMGSNDVRAIGICGMGGIGKTTIAKAFYNKYSNRFDANSFIENVKQYSQGDSPVLPLLRQLLIDLLRRNDYIIRKVENGIRQLKQILCSKKTLIVLDDLDQSSHTELLVRLCNLFSAGSRIMITTRDVNLLNQLKLDISEVDIYTVRELGHFDSLELFSYHAFRKPMPLKSFRELSIMFVAYAGGIPLALKVLGSSLRGRTQASFWKSKLEKVQKIPEKEIQKILQLSYNELDDDTHKAIFLDIAFFFVGKDKYEAVHIFESCDYFPDAGIPILVERCLLTIEEDNKFQMHNLIQDMGREIIREESKYGNCTRLCVYKEDAWEDLQYLEATDGIEGAIIDMSTWTKRHLNIKIFRRLPNLRLLEIIGGHDITEDFGNSFHQLRCIRWSHCSWNFLPSSFRPPKLVSLHMPFSKLKTTWVDITPPVSLKFLNVSYSKNLIMTPDFNNFKLVEKLLLRGCRNLLEVHASIGHLANLGHLDLGQCHLLKELPESVGQLTKLGHFDLHDCFSLKILPALINQLTNLSLLNMRCCYNLKRLPEQLGDMHGLQMLDLSRTAIKQLPDSSGKLINLVRLKLEFCKKLTSLPNSIWKLKFLQVLDLEYCLALERLPEQLGMMQSLKSLNACGTAINELPYSIGLLSRLRLLNLGCCDKLKYLPNSIKNLTSLTHLYTRQQHMVIMNLPDTVKNMKLKHLSLNCNLRIWLPMILSFSCLKTLTLSDEGQSFTSTKPFSLSKLSNLQYLRLVKWKSLGSSFPELPPNLRELRVIKYAALELLPDLSSLKQLHTLFIDRCISLLSLPPLPPYLLSLTAHGCTGLQYLRDLSKLKDLQHLSIVQCSNIKSITFKESWLQEGRRDFISSSFRADLPNREVPEWLSYKSSSCTVSFDVPPSLGNKFVGVVIWVVFKSFYKIKKTDVFIIRAVITNTRECIRKTYDMRAPTESKCMDSVGEVQSMVQCMRGDAFLMKDGDRIKVSFQRLLYSNGIVKLSSIDAMVEMCGAHLLRKPTISHIRDSIKAPNSSR